MKRLYLLVALLFRKASTAWTFQIKPFVDTSFSNHRGALVQLSAKQSFYADLALYDLVEHRLVELVKADGNKTDMATIPLKYKKRFECIQAIRNCRSSSHRFPSFGFKATT
jgi:hypothetical protein